MSKQWEKLTQQKKINNLRHNHITQIVKTLTMLSMQSKTNKKQNMLHQGGKIEFCS